MSFWLSAIGITLALWLIVFIFKRGSGGDTR